MGISVGIDLGTSNSVVAVMEEGVHVCCWTLAEETCSPPSSRWVKKTDGGGPCRAPATHLRPETTVSSAKRLIGRRFSDPETQRIADRSAGASSRERAAMQTSCAGKTYTAQEISAHVLTHMVRIAEEATGETVDSAVITVPAYSTMLSGRRRGTPPRSQTSSACASLMSPRPPRWRTGTTGHSQRIVVCDLGGGTFDVSVLHIGDDLIEVMSTAGDTFWVAMTSIKPSLITFEVRSRPTVRAPSRATTTRTFAQAGGRAAQARAQQSDQASTRIEDWSIAHRHRWTSRPPESRAGPHALHAPHSALFVVCDDALSQAGLSPCRSTGSPCGRDDPLPSSRMRSRSTSVRTPSITSIR